MTKDGVHLGLLRPLACSIPVSRCPQRGRGQSDKAPKVLPRPSQTADGRLLPAVQTCQIKRMFVISLAHKKVKINFYADDDLLFVKIMFC